MVSSNADSRRTRADLWARRAALLTLLMGAVLVLGPVAGHWKSAFDENPFEAPTVEEVVNTDKKITGNKPTTENSTVRTIKPGEDSFVEAALGKSGQLLVRVALVLFAAFLVGALVQRTLLGQFQLKLGPVELPATEAAAETAIDVVEQVDQVAREVAGQGQRTGQALVAVGQRLDAIDARIDLLESGDDSH